MVAAIVMLIPAPKPPERDGSPFNKGKMVNEMPRSGIARVMPRAGKQDGAGSNAEAKPLKLAR